LIGSPPADPKRLAIIGGGPAGLEAARIATARGHRVTIFEATEALGGQFLLAASLPGRSGLLRMVDHLVDEMRHAAVDIRLNTRVNDLSALDAEFDEVIVATGAVPAGLPDPRPLPVLSWAEVLRDGAPAPFGTGRAVFADDGTGFWFTYGVAEMLVAAGWHLTFLTTSAALGGHLPHESVAPMLGRLGAGGTDFRVLMAVESTRHGQGDSCQPDLGRRGHHRRPTCWSCRPGASWHRNRSGRAPGPPDRRLRDPPPHHPRAVRSPAPGPHPVGAAMTDTMTPDS
jgi:2,4-dienoyl-CoA reductase (NADPH2)